MIKKITFIIVIVLILFLIYYFLQQPKDKSPSINEATFIEPESIIKDDKDSIKPKKEISKEITNTENVSHQYVKPNGEEKYISYLDAYREKLFFHKCLLILRDNDNNIDPLESYIKQNERFKLSNGGLKDIQLQYYQIHIDQCLSLLVSEDEKSMTAFKRVYDRFEDANPETDEEISLANALEIEERILDITDKISQEKRGESQLTEEEEKAKIRRLLAIMKEMQTLTDKMMTPEYTETDKILFTKLRDEMSALNQSNTHLSNAEEVKFLQDELIAVLPELVEFFKNNQTPDVFLIFAKHVLNERRGKFFFTDDVNNLLGIYDTDYINTLNETIIPFIACTLDLPCGPESPLVINLCIYPKGKEPLACGRNLEDYYLEDLIGPNQMIDFNNYFNYLMDHYAHN